MEMHKGIDQDALWDYFTSIGWRDLFQARTIFSMLMDAVRHSAGGVILDAGAGRLRYRPFFEKTAVYIAQEHPMAVDLKGLGAAAYDILEPVDERIPLRDGCLDAIISTVVLEHLRYPERFFREAFRTLKPGGRLFAQAPFNYPEHEAPHDYQRPTRFGLARWFEDAGFEAVSVVPDSSDSVSATSFLLASLEKDLKAIGRQDDWDALRPELETFVKTIQDMTDGAVHAGSCYPVGWCSSGRKPGTHVLEERHAKSSFLAEFRLPA